MSIRLNFRMRRDTPAIVKKGNWVSNFPQPDLETVMVKQIVSVRP
jgi:hypothetical protein